MLAVIKHSTVWAWLAVSLGLHACAAAARPAANAHVPADHTTSAAGGSSAAQQLTAEPWSDASAKFHSRQAWLGADSAYSIDLDDGHVLWLFADTFIDPAADGSRENGPSYFIRNSIAIQSGQAGTEQSDRDSSHDLTRSDLQFYWGPNQTDPPHAPSSFFHDVDGAEEWIWPLHGARLADGRVLLFRMRVVKDTGGLGFRVDGWDALAIDDPLQTPESWKPRLLTQKLRTFGKLVGSSVLIHEDFLYAYAVENQAQDHAIYLLRWPIKQLMGLGPHALDDPQWWTSQGFAEESSLHDDNGPAAIWNDGQVELSVHYDAAHNQFIEIQMQGLFVAAANTQIGARTAARPEGPWSALVPFFRPPESSLSNAADLAAYAAKAHPEQRGGDLVLTYVVNDLKRFPPGDRVYYPQVVRAHYPVGE